MGCGRKNWQLPISTKANRGRIASTRRPAQFRRRALGADQTAALPKNWSVPDAYDNQLKCDPRFA